jgi:hypothetical protein
LLPALTKIRLVIIGEEWFSFNITCIPLSRVKVVAADTVDIPMPVNIAERIIVNSAADIAGRSRFK